jgi:hypothetical protein
MFFITKGGKEVNFTNSERIANVMFDELVKQHSVISHKIIPGVEVLKSVLVE